MPFILLSQADDDSGKVVYVDDQADTISFPDTVHALASQIHSHYRNKDVKAAVSFIYPLSPSLLSRIGCAPHGKAELFVAVMEGATLVFYLLDHCYRDLPNNGGRKFTPLKETKKNSDTNFVVKSVFVGPKQTISTREYRIFYCVATNHKVYPVGYGEDENGDLELKLLPPIAPTLSFHSAILASNFKLQGRPNMTIGDLVFLEDCDENTLRSCKAQPSATLYEHDDTLDGDVAFCNGASNNTLHQGALYVAVTTPAKLHVYQFKAKNEISNQNDLELVENYPYTDCTNEHVISMKAHPTTLFVLTNKALWAIKLDGGYTLKQNYKTHIARPPNSGVTFQGFALGEGSNSKPLLHVVVEDGSNNSTHLWTYSGDWSSLVRKTVPQPDPYTLQLAFGTRILANMDLKPPPVTHQLMTNGTVAASYHSMGMGKGKGKGKGKSFEDNLAMYAKYHRNLANIVTHIVGIPLIVLSIFVLLARAEVEWNGVMVPWLLLAVVAVLNTFYLLQNVRFALIMIALQIVYGHVAIGLATSSTTIEWLQQSGTLFAVGWGFQFLGHCFEGKKPAFFDDLMGLPIGPMFIVAEMLYFCGLFPDLPQITKSNH